MPRLQAASDSGQLDLVRQLSEAAPSWGIWKNVASAVSGRGDIDSVVRGVDEDRVERAFVQWAVERGLKPVFRCDHGGDLMRVLVAVDRDRSSIVELDLTRRKTYRGSTLFTAADVVPLLEDDAAGYRRVRPGVEGVLLLFHNGVRYGGRADPAGLAAREVVELLSRDQEGVQLGTALFTPAIGAARRAVSKLLAGQWDRGAVLTVELAFVVRAVLRPAGVARRLWFRAVTKRTCPIIRVAYSSGRRLPEDVDGWLRETMASHERLDNRHEGSADSLGHARDLDEATT